MTNQLKSFIPKLANQRIMVIGDVILDEYVTSKVTRMSREAPIPVLEFESRRLIPGGAANPAANIAALGSPPIQIGLVGADNHAEHLRQIMVQSNIQIDGLITDINRPTTVKTRIMAQMGLRFPQQVARLDNLSRKPIDDMIQQQVVDLTNSYEVDAILFSDYHNGLLTPSLVQQIRQSKRNIILTADAQGELGKYGNFALVKCNADEARNYLNRDINTHDEFGEAALELREKLELIGCMVITRGSDGITLGTSKGEVHHIPAPNVSDVYDTVGAGDTTIAVLTLALIAGASYVDAAKLANYASGIVVQKVGNYTPSPEELANAIR